MRLYLYFIVYILCTYSLPAQVFEVDTIKKSGNNDKRINLVILSEGYQSQELNQFIADAKRFSSVMFKQSPFKEYSNYFNVFAIKIPSNDSGADHPANAIDVSESNSNPVFKDTYFNATYDAFGFHRLLFYELNSSSNNNTEAKIFSVLAENFPEYDQALIIVNSDEFGGSGGLYPMSYNGFWGPNVNLHEIGHSLFNLIDEYYPVDDALAVEGINMTQTTNTSQVKWKNWINSNGVGIYQHNDDQGNLKPWYRPHQNCKMRRIDHNFCSVCKEGIIKKIFNLVSPIDNFNPDNLNAITPLQFPIDFEISLIQPNPNTLQSNWVLNNTNIADNVDIISLSEDKLIEGDNILTATVTDDSNLIRVDNQDTFHIHTVNWTITRATLGLNTIHSNTNTYAISVIPNPAKDIVGIKLENKNNNNLKIKITSLDGKTLKALTLFNNTLQNVDISNLSSGIYIINIYTDTTLLTSKKLIKK